MEVGEWTANGEWSATPELNKIYRDIRSFGLAQLLGLNRFNGWRDEGPNMADLPSMRAGRNWQA